MKRLILFAGLVCLFMAGCTPAETPLLPTPILPTAVGDSAAAPIALPDLLPTEVVLTEEVAPTSAEATPTLAATVTLAALPTAFPQTNPLIVTPSAALPLITRDLLFIGDGALRFWDKDLGRVDTILRGGDAALSAEPRALHQPIVGDITGYSVSDSGRAIVAAQLIARDPGIDPETVRLDRYTLTHIDLSDRNPRILLPDAINLRDFAIAGNGRYALAISTDGRQTTLEKRVDQVFLIDIGSATATLVATCSEGCSRVAWHPDSKNVVWGDFAQGMLLLNVEGSSYNPQLLIANQRSEPATTAVYTPISFSRSGQFLLSWQGAYEGGQRVVFDLPTAQVLTVPNSFVYASPFVAQITWMEDNRIFVVRPDMPNAPIAEIYRPVSDQGLVLEEQAALPVAGSYPLGAAHLENGRFGFALIRPGDAAASGLYILKGLGDDLDRANSALPAQEGWDSTSVWAGDSSGAILKQDSAVFYGPAFGTEIVDMRAAFGQISDQFQWLPPRPQ